MMLSIASVQETWVNGEHVKQYERNQQAKSRLWKILMDKWLSIFIRGIVRIKN